MCLAIPGKVIEIKEDSFVVDYLVEKREVYASAVEVAVGDYVIVSNKVIINKISEKEAKEFLELLA